LNTTPVITLGHGDLPVALLNSAQMLIGKREELYSLCLHEGDGLENFITKTAALISSLNEAKSILVFIDLQGGTPWNAIVGVNDPRVTLVTGVNLPMLIEVLLLRDQKSSIQDLVACALTAGKISVISKEFPLKGGV